MTFYCRELGERIEEALIRMKCPFKLQAHEIRGLNTGNIFPVVQWLVKKVIGKCCFQHFLKHGETL